MPDRYTPLAAGTYRVSSEFGPRGGEFHQGLDYAADKGTPFYAPVDGVVIEGADRTNVAGFGRWVWLDAQQSAGVDIIIGHGDAAVRGGDHVRAGQLLGWVNSHGQSTGPHAHVEVWTSPGRVGGRPIDPAPWFAGAADPGATPSKGPTVDNPITRTQTSPNQHGGARDVSWVAIHTQEGSGDILAYLCNPASEVSYNAVATDDESILVVPWDRNPWSATNANNRADHILLAGSYSAWSRGKWLERDASDGVDEDAMLTRAAALAAWRCTVRGLPIEYVGGGAQPPNRPGICGHRDFGQWGGGHTDPGPNFPWDEFIRRARAIAEGDDDMPSLDDIAKAVWAHRVRKPGARDGQDVPGVDNETAGNLLAWNDLHAAAAVDQLGGEHSKDRRDGTVTGWDQLGGRSVVDALAVIGERLGIDGFQAPKSGGKA